MKAITHDLRLSSLVATAVLSALAAGFSTVGVAADGAHAPAATVTYGDLDVSTVQGATALYARIRSAAEHVCASFDRPLDLNSQALRADCIRHAIAKGVAAVNEPALLVVYKANGGTPVPGVPCVAACGKRPARPVQVACTDQDSEANREARLCGKPDVGRD